MKRFLLLSLFAVCSWFGGSAQLVQVVNEVYYDPNVGPAVAGYPAGHITYRIYAELQDPTDFLSSVYAVAGCHTLSLDAGPGNAIWNSNFGGTLGSEINAAFFPIVPSLRYDSFGTIGRQDNTSPGANVGLIASCPAPGVWAASLGTVAGPALDVCDGAIYALNGDLNGFPTGPLNRVLLFQITMPAANTLSYKINVQVFNEGVGLNEIRYVWDEDNVGCGDPDEVSGTCLGLYYPLPQICLGTPGCTDMGACNYDPAATLDDGTCEYQSCAGCTDPTACNYDGGALIDDASCEYLSCAGCTDPGACNYDVLATLEDGSCTYPGCTEVSACNYDAAAGCEDGSCVFPGCTNVGACNYDPGAGCDDNSCEFLSCAGCTDPSACNYDGAATIEDGSCTFPGCTDPIALNYDPNAGCDNGACSYNEGCTDPLACNFDQGAVVEDGSCEYVSCAGCTNVAACNYDPAATIEDGTCEFISCAGCTDPGACNYDPSATIQDNSCEYLSCSGCTDPAACNYDISATIDDASCTYPGCTDIGACNYNANAGCDDNSCTYPGCIDPQACNYDANAGCSGNLNTCEYLSCAGCTEQGACNYNPAATLNDGSCEYQSCAGCTDADACNYDADATIDNGSCDFSCYGCTDAGACNYDANATQDDGSCDFSCFGCTDPDADNYNPVATIDDGSCIFGGLPAQSLDVQFFPNCINVLSGTSAPGANTGLPTPLGGDPNDEVFFAFVAPCNGGIKVDVEGFGIDAAVQLLDGLYSNIDASNSSGFGGTELCFADGLVGGNLYFVRVYDFGGGNGGGFNICLSAYCASSPDDPYPTLTYDACDVYKCDYIPGANSYDWFFTEQGDGTVLTYTSLGNNTFLNISNLSGPVEYGETYDVEIDTRFNDPDLGIVIIDGQITDVCVMNDAPFTELRSDFAGGNYQLNANIRCVQSCGADAYVWRLTPVGGSPLPTVEVGGASTIVNLCDFNGIRPGTTYDVEVAVVYNGVNHGFGPVVQISTAAQPVVFLRLADNCNNAGPLQLGAYIRTNAFVPCAKDWTWEFTRTDVPELPFYWRKGDGVRLLQLSAVKDLQTNTALLVPGATYNVRVKPEYGNFLGQGNDVPGLPPSYDFATSYGAPQQICIVGGAINGGGNNFTAEDIQPLREVGVGMEAALYPNPTNGSFVNLNIGNIAEGTDRVSVDVYDAFGKLVKSEQIAVKGNTFSAILTFGEGFSSGVYMVNITAGTSIITERLVIQK
jgi:hypothetical protein